MLCRSIKLMMIHTTQGKICNACILMGMKSTAEEVEIRSNESEKSVLVVAKSTFKIQETLNFHAEIIIFF